MLQLSLDFLERQFDRLRPMRVGATGGDRKFSWKHGIEVRIVRRPRARRYLLGLQPDGTARLVIPRRGTEAEALAFLGRSEAWLLRRLTQWRKRSHARSTWADGMCFLFRGEEVVLRVETTGDGVKLRFAGEEICLPRTQPDYRPAVWAYLRRMAEEELSLRTRELARQHGIAIRNVSIRGQRTRWGSCSTRGTISLNWRLMQTPPWVVDYMIIHELIHRREMNHSSRYWRQVEQAFPDYRAAEKWLKTCGLDLREGAS